MSLIFADSEEEMPPCFNRRIVYDYYEMFQSIYFEPRENDLRVQTFPTWNGDGTGIEYYLSVRRHYFKKDIFDVEKRYYLADIHYYHYRCSGFDFVKMDFMGLSSKTMFEIKYYIKNKTFAAIITYDNGFVSKVASSSKLDVHNPEVEDMVINILKLLGFKA